MGLLIFGAFLADFLLGVFALFGLEQAHVPSDFASRHYLTFTFPLLSRAFGPGVLGRSIGSATLLA